MRLLYAAFILLAFFPCTHATATCRLERGERYGMEAVIMENDLIRVVILPRSQGRIAEYSLNSSKMNMFMPLKETRVSILKDVEVVTSNFAGAKDFIYEFGLLHSAAQYQWRVTKDKPESCEIVLSYEGVSFAIEKTVTLYQGSTVMDMLVRLKNNTTTERCFSYWAHTCGVGPGGRHDIKDGADIALFAPTGPDSGHEKTERKRLGLVTCPQDTLYSYVPGTGMDRGTNLFLAPRQGWIGLVDTRGREAFAQIAPLDEIIHDGFFNAFFGVQEEDKRMLNSIEIVFNEAKLGPGQAVDRHIAFAGTSVMDKLSYASRTLFLSLAEERITLREGRARMVVTAAATRQLAKVTLEFLLKDNDNKAYATSSHAFVDIGPDVAVTRELLLDAGNAKGPLTIHFRMLDGNGACLEEAPLIGAYVVAR